MPDRYVLLDVDGVCVDYNGAPMPGIGRLVKTFEALGYAVVLWSAGGRNYCWEAAARCGFKPVNAFTKPDYPIQEAAALALLKHPPVLQLDDDPTERVADWPFMEVTEAPELFDYLLTRKGGSQDTGAKPIHTCTPGLIGSAYGCPACGLRDPDLDVERPLCPGGITEHESGALIFDDLD